MVDTYFLTGSLPTSSLPDSFSLDSSLSSWSETWPFSSDLLPADAYLVGGSVRDRLLNRQSSYLDLDFVLPERAVETAAKIAQVCEAGFVVLDEARHIARVVFEQATVDFAQQQGASVEDDLRRRDFTINAIAYSPHQKKLIDPLGGEADIAACTVRMVNAENLADDPLRLLRGYRQAAQLGFGLDVKTQVAIGTLAPQLQLVSMERVRSELDALLSVSSVADDGQFSDGQFISQLHDLQQQQLLQFCLPHFTPTGVDQIAAIDEAFQQFLQVMPTYAERLKSWAKPVPTGCYRSWLKAAKLSSLLGTDAVAAGKQMSELKYSRAEAQVVQTLIQVQAYTKALCSGPLSRAQAFFFFKAVGDAFPAASLLAVAQGADMATVQALIDQFLNPQDVIAHARPLITGTTLMKKLNIAPGPEIGTWINLLEQAQAAGDILSAEDAIAWVEHHKD
ncbi:MAG: CCA tRNA nucleotidyltransferase [Cyanobacteria bacterium P01_F01_bin.53]